MESHDSSWNLSVIRKQSYHLVQTNISWFSANWWPMKRCLIQKSHTRNISRGVKHTDGIGYIRIFTLLQWVPLSTAEVERTSLHNKLTTTGWPLQDFRQRREKKILLSKSPNIFWSDETKTELFECHNTHHVWRPKAAAYHPKDNSEVWRWGHHGVGLLSIWQWQFSYNLKEEWLEKCTKTFLIKICCQDDEDETMVDISARQRSKAHRQQNSELVLEKKIRLLERRSQSADMNLISRIEMWPHEVWSQTPKALHIKHKTLSLL